jgi:hypothetical protein
MSVTEIKKINVILRTLKITSCQRTCLKNLIDLLMAHERAAGRGRGQGSLEGTQITLGTSEDEVLRDRVRASLETIEL